MPCLTGTSPADVHNSSNKRMTRKSRENPKYIRSDSSPTITDYLTSDMCWDPIIHQFWGREAFIYLSEKGWPHAAEPVSSLGGGDGVLCVLLFPSSLLHLPTGWAWRLPSEGKCGCGSPVTRAGVGSYYLIMTTTHIQGTALGNTHTPSARSHGLAVGVQERSLTSVNFIPGDRKCRSPCTALPREASRGRAFLHDIVITAFSKMLIFTINKLNLFMQIVLENKQAAFMSYLELGLGWDLW